MLGNDSSVQFVKATREGVLSFLDQAQSQVVIAKAGYFTDEVNKLLELVEHRKVRCKVYVDTNDKSIRYGFGEQIALELLNEKIDILELQSANFIRMAIIIVDDSVMVYSPVALSWEEIPANIDFPNGIVGGKDLADSLMLQVEGGNYNIELEGLNVEIPVCPIVQKEPEEIKEEISQTIIKLKENPPVDPARLRKTTFYRQKYKLLKMTVYGVKIKGKSISLRPFNSMFAKTDERLKSSWNVLTKTDVESLAVINDFITMAGQILLKNTFDAKRFGTLIETKNINLVMGCITFQVYDLISSLMGASGTENNQEDNRTSVSLVDLLESSRVSLIEHLYPRALADESCLPKLFANDQSLFRQLKDGKIEKEKAIKQAVETFVDNRLNFPDAQGMIDLIHIEFDFYDISDELLTKDEFIENVEKFDLHIRDYQEGYEKRCQQNLFEISEQ